MTVHQESWTHFVENLTTEWQQITIGVSFSAVSPLFASLLDTPSYKSSITLIITVVFLCVPGVRNGSTSRNPSETLSYISGASSAGSVVLGMLLGRRYGDRPMETVDEAVSLTPSVAHCDLMMIHSLMQAKFLYSKSRIFGGIEALAILYGLPYALMIWGWVPFYLLIAECWTRSVKKDFNIPRRILIRVFHHTRSRRIIRFGCILDSNRAIHYVVSLGSMGIRRQFVL